MKRPDKKALTGRLQEYVRYSELKQLAYNIAALQQEKMFHSLAVLSFFPSEGKTLFCAALAMAYAETTRSPVLVLDTTTFQNKHSIALNECFDASQLGVEVMSLEELRHHSNGAPPQVSRGPQSVKMPALEPEIVQDKPIHVPMAQENDFSLLKRITAERSKKFALVLLDTAPLTAKNKSNIDPLLVARLSDASVLVVSRELLKAPNLTARLKVIEDPSLHLVGLVSNEEFAQ